MINNRVAAGERTVASSIAHSSHFFEGIYEYRLDAAAG